MSHVGTILNTDVSDQGGVLEPVIYHHGLFSDYFFSFISFLLSLVGFEPLTPSHVFSSFVSLLCSSMSDLVLRSHDVMNCIALDPYEAGRC